MNCLLPRRSSQLKTVNAFIRWTVLRSFFEGGATFTTVAECCPYKHPISKMLFCFSDRLTVVKRKCASVLGTRSQTNLLWICGREGKKKTPNKNPMSGFQDLNKIESTKSWDCIWDLSPCFDKPLGLANSLSCSEDSVKLNHTYHTLNRVCQINFTLACFWQFVTCIEKWGVQRKVNILWQE